MNSQYTYPWSHGFRDRNNVDGWDAETWAESVTLLILGRAEEIPTRKKTRRSESLGSLGRCWYGYVSTAVLGYSEAILICIPRPDASEHRHEGDPSLVTCFDTGGLINGLITRASGYENIPSADILEKHTYHISVYEKQFEDYITSCYSSLQAYMRNDPPDHPIDEIDIDNAFFAFVWEGRVPKPIFQQCIHVMSLAATGDQIARLSTRMVSSKLLSSDEFDYVASWLGAIDSYANEGGFGVWEKAINEMIDIIDSQSN